MGRLNRRFFPKRKGVGKIAGREANGSVNTGNSQVNDSISETLLIGTIADLLEEIKNLFSAIRRYKKSKEESVQLFQSLLRHYHPLIGIYYRDIISLFIYDISKRHQRIQMPLNEIRSWWYCR